MTEEEKELIASIWQRIEYWDSIDFAEEDARKRFPHPPWWPKESDRRKRLEGLAHSLLALLSGAAEGPAYVLESESNPEVRIASMLHQDLFAGKRARNEKLREAWEKEQRNRDPELS